MLQKLMAQHFDVSTKLPAVITQWLIGAEKKPTGHNIVTQKFTKNISYMIHNFPCHIIYSHMQTINKTNYTERQQFSAVTVGLKSGFLKVFFKKLKTKIWTF